MSGEAISNQPGAANGALCKKAELASCKTLAKKDHANAMDAALDVKRRESLLERRVPTQL